MRKIAIFLVMIFIDGSIFASSKESNYEVFAQKCSSCHGLEIIEKKQKSREEWKNTIKRMEKYGAKFDGKQGQILEYLVNKK
ncbi:hypothetical protein [Calditerrivibrio nitroreducens]|uniref:Quinohemoprotein amine dehydrogenase alpha subunit haem binding domain-containing protein n=1 Tax=Calditerrivibrio nitroreducens (strain DSM 19672 / NBRC 101217 / Yu37-1) TaxID=768670 RepID=E4TJ67_CALNY|nr:hypothetical protein [Calditerrivibrio nitroreducens]ADR18103.1 hypothetical protein Calni_0190 [Calditerrivibrio nitroreducens DSM 19672]